MPISRYQVRNVYSLADPELYKAADKDDPEALLEGVAMAGLVGVLRQLGDLAEFAAGIFHGLHEEVRATASRGHGVLARVQQLESEFPSIERAFLSQTSHSPFFPNPGIEWHPNRQTEQNLITKGDLPRFLMDSYEECRGPPRLFLLDKFDVAGAGACLKRYTDPSFYKVEASSYETASAKTQRDKKIRKTKKKGSQWTGRETPQVSPPSHKLHQLFLEERVQNGAIEPERRVKLKKRPNKFPFNSENGNCYMEKLLNSPSVDKLVHEVSLHSSTLKLPPNNSNESRLEILEGSMVISASNIDLGLHEEVYEKHISVDSETRTEGLQDGYKSDDVASETDNYVDALATMEPELETDAEFRAKTSPNINQETNFESNVEQLQSQLSDSQSIENSYSNSTSTSAENTPPQAFACTEIPFRPRISSNKVLNEKISVSQHPDQEILNDSCIRSAIDAPLSVDEEEILEESNEMSSNNGENLDSPQRVSSNQVSYEKISVTPHPDQEISNDSCIRSGIDAPLSVDEEILEESKEMSSNNDEDPDSPRRVSSIDISNEKISVTPRPDQEILNDSCIRSAIAAPLSVDEEEILEESKEMSSNNGEDLDSPRRVSSNDVSNEKISVTPRPDQEILNDSCIRSAIATPLSLDEEEILEESKEMSSSNGEDLDSPRRVSSNDVSNEKISVTPHPDQEILNDSSVRSAIAAPLPVDEEEILEESNEAAPLPVDEEEILEESNEMASKDGENLESPRNTEERDVEVNLDYTSKLSDVLQTAGDLSSSSSLRDDEGKIDNEHLNDTDQAEYAEDNRSTCSVISHPDVNPTESTIPEGELKEIGDENVHIYDSGEARVSYSSNDETESNNSEIKVSVFKDETEMESVKDVFTLENDKELEGREADSVNLETVTNVDVLGSVDVDKNEDNDVSIEEHIKQNSMDPSANSKILEDQSHYVLEETDQNGVQPVVLCNLDSQPGENAPSDHSKVQFLDIASDSAVFTEADHDLESKSLNDHVDKSEAEQLCTLKDKVDQVKPLFSGFDMLPQLAPVNLEETPPLPPLPPMQWRTRKLENASLTHNSVNHDHFAPIFSSLNTENQKSQHAYEDSSGIMESFSQISENFVPQPVVKMEQFHSVPRTSDQETFGPSSSPTIDDERPNGIRPMKIHRPRSPLIDAVAAHDKTKLRKVSERATSQIQKEEESDTLLEQIRAKSFNLKRAVQTRPSIQGPKTNLRVAAILEKANAIRQAFAGSDDDDDDSDSWSDS